MKSSYRIRISERLDPAWSGWLYNVAIVHNGDGSTTLTGAVHGAATLEKLLSRLRELGATVIAVEAVATTVQQSIITTADE